MFVAFRIECECVCKKKQNKKKETFLSNAPASQWANIIDYLQVKPMSMELTMDLIPLILPANINYQKKNDNEITISSSSS